MWLRLTVTPTLGRNYILQFIVTLAVLAAVRTIVIGSAALLVLDFAAMLRYNTWAVRPAPTGIVEQFLDNRYDDDYTERRWPNMIVTEP